MLTKAAIIFFLLEIQQIYVCIVKFTKKTVQECTSNRQKAQCACPTTQEYEPKNQSVHTLIFWFMYCEITHFVKFYYTLK